MSEWSVTRSVLRLPWAAGSWDVARSCVRRRVRCPLAANPPEAGWGLGDGCSWGFARKVACVCFACLGRRPREWPRVDRVRTPLAHAPARPGERAVVGGREILRKTVVATVERGLRAPARHVFRRLAGIAECCLVNHVLLQIVSYRRWASDVPSIGCLAPSRSIGRGGLFGVVVIPVTRQWAGPVRPKRQGQSATDREEQCQGKHHHDSCAHLSLIGAREGEL